MSGILFAASKHRGGMKPPPRLKAAGPTAGLEWIATTTRREDYRLDHSEPYVTPGHNNRTLIPVLGVNLAASNVAWPEASQDPFARAQTSSSTTFQSIDDKAISKDQYRKKDSPIGSKIAPIVLDDSDIEDSDQNDSFHQDDFVEPPPSFPRPNGDHDDFFKELTEAKARELLKTANANVAELDKVTIPKYKQDYISKVLETLRVEPVEGFVADDTAPYGLLKDGKAVIPITAKGVLLMGYSFVEFIEEAEERPKDATIKKHLDGRFSTNQSLVWRVFKGSDFESLVMAAKQSADEKESQLRSETMKSKAAVGATRENAAIGLSSPHEDCAVQCTRLGVTRATHFMSPGAEQSSRLSTDRGDSIHLDDALLGPSLPPEDCARKQPSTVKSGCLGETHAARFMSPGVDHSSQHEASQSAPDVEELLASVLHAHAVELETQNGLLCFLNARNTANEKNIASNTKNIASNKKNIASNTKKIETHGARTAALEARTAANEANTAAELDAIKSRLFAVENGE